MKRQELIKSMERIMPGSTAGGAIENHQLPIVASFVAAHAFIHEKADDADAGNLKEYLLALEKDGYYKFEEES